MANIRKPPKLPPPYAARALDVKFPDGETHTQGFLVERGTGIMRSVGILDIGGCGLICCIAGAVGRFREGKRDWLIGVHADRTTVGYPLADFRFRDPATRDKWLAMMQWQDVNGVLFATELKPPG